MQKRIKCNNPKGPPKVPSAKGRREPEVSGGEELTRENRRQQILRLRMHWPPYSVRSIAQALGCSTTTVCNDLKYLRTEFSSEYFAENNRAAVARACAEAQALAFQFLSEADALRPSWVQEKAALYGRALQALQMRNDIMTECGIMSKAAIKIETSGPDGKPMQFDLTTTSIQDRINALRASSVAAAIVQPKEQASE
jgi:hypothetical protein